MPLVYASVVSCNSMLGTMPLVHASVTSCCSIFVAMPLVYTSVTSCCSMLVTMPLVHASVGIINCQWSDQMGNIEKFNCTKLKHHTKFKKLAFLKIIHISHVISEQHTWIWIFCKTINRKLLDLTDFRYFFSIRASNYGIYQTYSYHKLRR